MWLVQSKIPETKNIFGSKFGWADILSYQRQLWENSKIIPQITFYPGDPNLNPIIDYFLDKYVNINISKELEKIPDYFPKNVKSKIFQYQTFFKSNNSKADVVQKLVNETYKNVELVGINSSTLGLTDAQLDQILGQFFTIVGVSTLIIAIFIVCLIFLTIFCLGCCCCCNGKTRNNPNWISIIFFGIAFLLMIIGSIAQIASIFGIYNCWNFAVNDFNPITNEVFVSLNNTINDMYGPIKKGLGMPLNNLISKILSVKLDIDEASSSVFNNATDAVDILEYKIYSGYLKDILPNINSTINTISEINKRVKEESICNDSFKIDQIISPDQLDKAKQFSVYLTEIKKSINTLNDLTNFPEEALFVFIEFLNSISPYLNNPENKINFQEIMNLKSKLLKVGNNLMDIKKINISDEFTFNTDIFVKIMVIIPGVIMVLLTVLFAFAFFTHCCCSRCISSCCACVGPCFCNLFGLICGTITSIFLVAAVLLMHNLIDSGDYALNALVDKTFVDRTIQIPDINLTNVTHGVIDVIHFDPVRFNEKIYFMKHFLEANLDDSLLKAANLKKWLPIPQLGSFMNMTFTNLANSANLTIFSDMVTSMQTQINQNIPKSLDQIMGSDFNFTEKISEARNNIEKLRQLMNQTKGTNFSNCTATENELNTIIEAVNLTEAGYSRLFPIYDDALMIINNGVLLGLASLINTFDASIKILFGETGNSIQIITTNLYSILDSTTARPLIGLINMARTSMLYEFTFFCLLSSIAAHLFMVGEFIMVINLWIRRRGMNDQPEITFSTDYSSSSFASKSDNSSNDYGSKISFRVNQSHPKNIDGIHNSQHKKERLSTEYYSNDSFDNHQQHKHEEFVF
ncbi:hypothetical protein TRFO_02637 [Tritrichomonas foetus]|uniref:Prominin n=1 Tax=Tritrichomonas foetus TaxID=1144522 RepID=A0A1J4KYS8_9EUKA|nr:hypothetical protein TRFO_02637 [Tritrichomonas foetus]|eukprot:OHT16401.1 hypothetical protein TRFO_02637 [Tritrichomonas foetus]